MHGELVSPWGGRGDASWAGRCLGMSDSAETLHATEEEGIASQALSLLCRAPPRVQQEVHIFLKYFLEFQRGFRGPCVCVRTTFLEIPPQLSETTLLLLQPAVQSARWL